MFNVKDGFVLHVRIIFTVALDVGLENVGLENVGLINTVGLRTFAFIIATHSTDTQHAH